MYCTVSDVRNALAPGGDASRPGGTAASLTDEQLVDAIREADTVIDLHLSSRYTIPLDEVEGEATTVAPQPVRFWSRNIAAYLATLTFSRNRNIPVDEPVRLRYDQTMQYLVAVRDGRSDLNLPPVAPNTGPSDVEVINAYEGTLFGADDFHIGVGGGYGGYPNSFSHWPGY